MSHTEEPEMSGQVRHIEQGIVLTELIQIEPYDAITCHHDVLCRKIAMGRPGYPLSEGVAALPDADQEIGEERGLGAAALPREEMHDGDTAVDQVSTGTKPARQQPRQDLEQTHRFL